MKKTFDRNYQNNTTVEIADDKSRADVDVEGFNGLLHLDEDDVKCVMTPTMYMAMKEHELHREQYKKVFDELNERRYVAPSKDDVVACGHKRDDDYITEKNVINYCTQPEKAMKNESIIRRMYEAKKDFEIPQDGDNIWDPKFDDYFNSLDDEDNALNSGTVADMIRNRLIFDHKYQFKNKKGISPNFESEPKVFQSGALNADGKMMPSEKDEKNVRFSPNQAVRTFGGKNDETQITYGMLAESDYELVDYLAKRFHFDHDMQETSSHERMPYAFYIKIPEEMQEVDGDVLLRVESLSNGFKEGFEKRFDRVQALNHDYLDYKNVCEYYFNDVDVNLIRQKTGDRAIKGAVLSVSGPKF